jgi:hypothetical protein
MPQTEQFYSALKLRKVPTAMIPHEQRMARTTSTPSNFIGRSCICDIGSISMQADCGDDDRGAQQ